MDSFRGGGEVGDLKGGDPKGGGEKVKEAAVKSMEKSKATMEGSARSAAEMTGKTIRNTKEKACSSSWLSKKIAYGSKLCAFNLTSNISESIQFANFFLGQPPRLMDKHKRNWKMEWAGREKHMGGIPRKLVIMAVGTFAKAVATLLNTTSVHNADTLIHLVRSRPPGVPLITVSNHMSTSVIGKCIPITRGGGIYQEHMTEALERLNDGAWLHTFPEGKVSQEDAPIRRLKWGTASLIVRAAVTPIVLPIVHQGFEEVVVMPENFMFGKRPPFPLCYKSVNMVVGEPIEFNLPKMREKAISMSRDPSLPSRGWPVTSPCGLNEAAQICLYSSVSEQIRTVMESLRRYGTSILKQKL
ncbi:hypothetical protein EZV62_004429 [Acer yangbiense]|uniref:Tafazzin family protein n=1 Tax=Acer yangbiense TaxID=1000413 RepID=A0A5C7IKT5_9ROSI|nr:hypothetical protein EZV62_004429 [Acer yangbiense]